jgi:hypothetical protein
MSNRRPGGGGTPSLHCTLATPGAALILVLGFLSSAGLANAGPFNDPGHPIGNMVAWVAEVDELLRGPMDIEAPTGGDASFGSEANVVGIATANPVDTVSLGDGGSITLYFESGIGNGPNDDFAVYENGFFDLNGLFAELAYVEVASNGVDFARFDSRALNPIPVWPYESLDPSDYHGLAGRHEAGLGTGFDLGDLHMDPLVISGIVDIFDVRYVRLVDVVGNGWTFDGLGNSIYDPFKTDFPAGGFDLEAIGVIHVPEPGLVVGLLFGIFGLVVIGAYCRGGQTRSRAMLLSSPLVLLSISAPAGALTSTFEDLGLGAESTLNGSTLAGGYTSGDVFFENNYDAGFNSFTGFAASTTTDVTTPGFGNQFSNITGSGAGGSSGFGLAFENARVVLPSTQIVLGAEFTNTTYTALSMLNGDGFAKQFGGPTTDDPDFFRLLIEGIDHLGSSTGVVELMLADYRFGDNNLDFALDQWIFRDLTSLGLVKELHFSFESSDVSLFNGTEYLNTPAYFAIDNLATIPEPDTAILIGLGLAWMANRRREER